MSGGSTNTVSQSTVPAWVQPYLSGALAQGSTLLNSGGPQYYPGQTVAGLTPLQNQGVSDASSEASNPSASSQAQQQNMNIESGAYLNPNTNPYLAGTLQTANQGVQNQISSEFAGSGRNIIGSAPVQSSAMNQLANEIYGGAYNTGMQQMVQSQAIAPTLDAGTYLPSQEELSVGGGLQSQNQNQINALMNQFNYQQQLPENMLSWYSGLLGQNAAPFGGQSSTSSGSNNAAMQDAGLGVGALSALSSSGLLSSLFGAGAGSGLLAGGTDLAEGAALAA